VWWFKNILFAEDVHVPSLIVLSEGDIVVPSADVSIRLCFGVYANFAVCGSGLSDAVFRFYRFLAQDLSSRVSESVNQKCQKCPLRP
jgi:hypothetical protein